MHIPVLLNEVLKYLDPQPNQNFIDCTFGLGGHAKAILEKTAPYGKVLAIEVDTELYQQITNQSKKFSNKLLLVNDSYTNLKKIIEQYNFGPVSGILLDLGLSKWHLLNSGRGFTFQKNEPLNMRYAGTGEGQVRDRCTPVPETAGEIVNEWNKEEIERILREYGEERFAGAIAKKIVEKRRRKKIETTFELAEAVKEAIPKRFQHKKIHPATKTFQALRIAVNGELENLRLVLPQVMEILKKGGRLAIISFHSLEDRIVKNFFRENKNKGLAEILTKKPVVPGQDEILKNPCSRSAKLRAAAKKDNL